MSFMKQLHHHGHVTLGIDYASRVEFVVICTTTVRYGHNGKITGMWAQTNTQKQFIHKLNVKWMNRNNSVKENDISPNF